MNLNINPDWLLRMAEKDFPRTNRSPDVGERRHSDTHAFDPDRFSPERESELVTGTYLPFGWGPRVCVGASFATTESALILARLARRFDFAAEQPGRVRPVARLTTRPAEQIMCRVTRA